MNKKSLKLVKLLVYLKVIKQNQTSIDITVKLSLSENLQRLSMTSGNAGGSSVQEMRRRRKESLKRSEEATNLEDIPHHLGRRFSEDHSIYSSGSDNDVFGVKDGDGEDDFKSVLSHKPSSSRKGSLYRSRRGSIGSIDSALSDKQDGQYQPQKRRLRDSKRLIFFLGILFGLSIPCYFGVTHLQNNNKDLLDKYLTLDNVKGYFDEWTDSIPPGFQTFLSDVQKKLIPEESMEKNLQYSFAVGKQLIKEIDGIGAKHPVVMVPGVISTGIESWGVTGDEECDSTPHFRKRLWGSFYMLRTMFLDKICWLKHVKLDPITGLDPANFTLRAAQGFESSDFFVAGYWIWNKVIENLGAIGYNPNKMITAAYDWRLAYLDLEKRDKYFSKLKLQIETFHDLTGEKSVVIGHSMGSQVVFYFLQWVEAEGPHYGNGGPGWVDKHIGSFINVAGTLLGAPKAVPALISGEMKDTIDLNTFAMYGLEKFFSRKERLDMLQTWGGIPSMLPKGGDLIWGNLTHSYEDNQLNGTDTYGNFIRFSETAPEDANITLRHTKDELTMQDALDLVMELSPDWLQTRIKDQYSYGYARSPEELKENKKHHSHWSNPLEVPLPNAPDMKIYCIYGVNNPTERAYVYQEETHKTNHSLNLTIDYDAPAPVLLTDGDGTVPVLSHSMCYKWAEGKSAYNPGGSEVTIVEIKHRPDTWDMRGGGVSADHVDILGSSELNEYILKIASGNGHLIKDRRLTNLTQWVEAMPWPFHEKDEEQVE